MNMLIFNSLSDKRQKEIIVDAQKVAEYQDGDAERYELFGIEDFFIEVKVNFWERNRKILNTYSMKDIPINYDGKFIT